MADAKYRFCLTDDEKRELNQMVSSGKRNARQVLDALILLNCDESEGKKQSDEIIGGFLKVGKLRVHRVRKRFFENGMSGVFNLPHGGGRSKQIDGDFEAHLIALSCGEPPEGHSQWSLRLLADKMVELEYVESVSHELGMRQLMFDYGNLESLCHSCHSDTHRRAFSHSKEAVQANNRRATERFAKKFLK